MKIAEGNTYRHVKRGSLYEVLGRAKMQIATGYGGWQQIQDLEKVTFIVYKSLADHTLWVRPESEFCDGRFVEVVCRTRYCIARRRPAGLPVEYYRSGEGHGWTEDKSEATLYGEQDFADRDLASLPRDVRTVSLIIAVERWETVDGK